MTAPPKVFISYSHDSVQHVERVRALADGLARNGVEVELDQYHEHDPPAKGWNLWAEAQVRSSQFVLLVCTKTYLRRYQKEENPGEGLGATYEAALIRDALTRGSLKSGKIFGLAFSPADVEFIPPPLRDTHYLVLDSDESREALLRLLHGKPGAVRPPLGTAPDLPPRPAMPIEAFDPSRKPIGSPQIRRQLTDAILLGAGAVVVAIAVILAMRPGTSGPDVMPVAAPAEEGSYRIQALLGGYLTAESDGQPLLCDALTDDRQRWIVTPQRDGSYRLRSAWGNRPPEQAPHLTATAPGVVALTPAITGSHQSDWRMISDSRGWVIASAETFPNTTGPGTPRLDWGLDFKKGGSPCVPLCSDEVPTPPRDSQLWLLVPWNS